MTTDIEDFKKITNNHIKSLEKAINDAVEMNSLTPFYDLMNKYTCILKEIDKPVEYPSIPVDIFKGE
jgi:hypothetical protein